MNFIKSIIAKIRSLFRHEPGTVVDILQPDTQAETNSILAGAFSQAREEERIPRAFGTIVEYRSLANGKVLWQSGVLVELNLVGDMEAASLCSLMPRGNPEVLVYPAIRHLLTRRETLLPDLIIKADVESWLTYKVKKEVEARRGAVLLEQAGFGCPEDSCEQRLVDLSDMHRGLLALSKRSSMANNLSMMAMIKMLDTGIPDGLAINTRTEKDKQKLEAFLAH